MMSGNDLSERGGFKSPNERYQGRTSLTPPRDCLNSSVLRASASSTRGTPNRLDEKFINTNQISRRAIIFDATKYVCKDLDLDEVLALREVFMRWDQDGNGTLSPMEMKLALMQYEKNISQQQVIAIFSTLDQHGTGGVDFESFISAFKQKTISDSIDRMYLMYDIERKGFITQQDLANFTTRKLKMREDESILRDIIECAGTDGKISKQQFIDVMNAFYLSLKE